MNKFFLVFLLTFSLYNYSKVNGGGAISKSIAKVKDAPYKATKKIISMPKDILTKVMTTELNLNKKVIIFSLLTLFFLAQMNNYEEIPTEFLEANLPDFLNKKCYEIITDGYVRFNGEYHTIEDIKIIVCEFFPSNITEKLGLFD